MQAVTTIGLDIAKSVFQVHGVDVTGQVVIRRQFVNRRRTLTPPRTCLKYLARRLQLPFSENPIGVQA
jgi:transposase